jgi:hypothetical protein
MNSSEWRSMGDWSNWENSMHWSIRLKPYYRLVPTDDTRFKTGSKLIKFDGEIIEGTDFYELMDSIEAIYRKNLEFTLEVSHIDPTP